jgi:hypothetical protein
MPYNGINWAEEIEKAVELGKQGKSYEEIGAHFGVSRQRVKQVFQKFEIDPTEVGVRLRTHKNKETAEKLYQDKWGNKQKTDLYQAQRTKFRGKKSNAVRTGFTWDVEFGDLYWPTHCPILGLELDYFSEFCTEASPSFDRTNSDLGYVKGNVKIISWRANRIKNNGTAEEHRKIADYLDKLQEMP